MLCCEGPQARTLALLQTTSVALPWPQPTPLSLHQPQLTPLLPNLALAPLLSQGLASPQQQERAPLHLANMTSCGRMTADAEAASCHTAGGRPDNSSTCLAGNGRQMCTPLVACSARCIPYACALVHREQQLPYVQEYKQDRSLTCSKMVRACTLWA